MGNPGLIKCNWMKVLILLRSWEAWFVAQGLILEMSVQPNVCVFFGNV